MRVFEKIGVVLCLLSFSVAAYSNDKVRKGYAYDQDSGEKIYTEVHNETWEDGYMLQDRVEYFFPDGRLIANKTVDYGSIPQVPDFELSNLVSGHYERASRKENKYEVSFQEKAGDKRKTALISIPEQAVSDAGFDRMIEADWDKLINGETIKKDFLVPSMKRFFRFRIFQSRIVSADGTQYREIIMEPQNFLLRLAAGKTVLMYDHDAPQLRRFEGVSNMRDKKGDNYRVVILYPSEEIKLAALKDLQ